MTTELCPARAEDRLVRPVPENGRAGARRPHFLLPTSMLPQDVATLRMGLQLASALGGRVTLLHVLPALPQADEAQVPEHSWHWLDGIEMLHQRLIGGHFESEQARVEKARAKLKRFCELAAADQELDLPEISIESACGDVAEEVLRFARSETIDIVILSSRLSVWGLPVVPPRLHQMLQQMRKSVIVVRPGANGEPATRASQRKPQPRLAEREIEEAAEWERM